MDEKSDGNDENTYNIGDFDNVQCGCGSKSLLQLLMWM
jgi:hypothetical protein